MPILYHTQRKIAFSIFRRGTHLIAHPLYGSLHPLHDYTLYARTCGVKLISRPRCFPLPFLFANRGDMRFPALSNVNFLKIKDVKKLYILTMNETLAFYQGSRETRPRIPNSRSICKGYNETFYPLNECSFPACTGVSCVASYSGILSPIPIERLYNALCIRLR